MSEKTANRLRILSSVVFITQALVFVILAFCFMRTKLIVSLIFIALAFISVLLQIPFHKIAADITRYSERKKAHNLADIYAPANIKTTTWTSSDESVAKVVDGTITAVKPGNATIYVSCNGFTAQATVNVKSYLESISIGEDFALDPSQEQKLIVTYNPTDTTDSKTVTWISSNPEVATVDAEGNVKALTPGNTIITAKETPSNSTGPNFFFFFLLFAIKISPTFLTYIIIL